MIIQERLVGEAARIQGQLDPVNTVYNAKRFIGKQFEEQLISDNLSR